MPEPTKIVILGGGYAGISAATRLDKILGSRDDIRLSLVTERDAFLHSVGTPRTVVEPSFAEKVFIPYTRLFLKSKSATVVQGQAIGIERNQVLLKDKQTVPFDYLIIATGTSYPSPSKVHALTKADGVEALKTIADRVQQADNILIIGGGPVGCEIAGEIAVDYPTKKVTLVHARETLMPGPLPAKFKSSLADALRSRGVEVVLGERVENLASLFPNPVETGFYFSSSGVTVKTDKDRSIAAQLVLLASGNGRYNSDCAKSLSADLVDANGQIRVLPTLQINDIQHPHIFAIGDVCDADDKEAWIAKIQAVLAADNLVKLIDHGEKAKLKTYSLPFKNLAFVSLGRTGGVAQLVFVIGDYLTKMIKSGDMMTKRTWGDLNMGAEYK